MARGGSTAACHAQPADKPLGPGLAARSSRGGGPRRAGTGRAPCSRGAITTRSSSARQCSDALDGGVVGAGEVEAGLTLAVARRAGAERGVGAGAMAGVGGDGAPVSSGALDMRRGREL
jgi:hypothetical protein